MEHNVAHPFFVGWIAMKRFCKTILHPSGGKVGRAVPSAPRQPVTGNFQDGALGTARPTSGSWEELALASCFLIALCGCGGYALGPTNGIAARSRSIQVNHFQNDTLEPRLIQPVNAALRKNLQQEGTYRLATHNDGDIVVNGVIVRYERSALSFQPTDILTVRDYRVNLIAHVKAVDRSSGRVLLDREVRGRTILRAGADIASADRQAIPLLADDLARNITSLLVDGTW